MNFERGNHTDEFLKALYQSLLLPRMIEEKMLVLLRQGKISKWFSGIGQEAIAAGAVMALDPDEYILPLHRNLAVFTGRGMSLHKLFSQWQGTAGGYTKGRERSFHFGSKAHHIVGMISHLGPQNGVANGIALASKLQNEKKVTLVFNGEGATSEGDFHEALNVASVWDLPVIFLIENNGYGLSTPVTEQYRCKSLVDRAAGYGMRGIQVDGNNVLAVYETIRDVASEMRNIPSPVLIECMTFRMRGHEEASGIKYVPKKLLDTWSKRDPVNTYEQFLLTEKVIDPDYVDLTRDRIHRYIDEELAIAFKDNPPVPDAEVSDVYASVDLTPTVPSASTTEKRFVDAISDGLSQSLEKFPNLIMMGQDIAEYGGVFKVTEGLVARFGKERIRNTPLCESAIIGAALGLSIRGHKAIVEMQFADFVTQGFNQIVNNLAKIHWRWGQNADVVIRMPTGAGTGAGPFHSQSNEAWFFHTPGLKIVYPSTPHDAKGLLCAAIEDPNPVLFFEHKFLYRSIKGPVPDNYFTELIGKAKLVKEGDDVTIITYGLGVHWVLDILPEFPLVRADVVDLRSLLPLDYESIAASVKKTGKVLIVHEDTLTGGIGAEIAAWISEHCFEWLDAPVSRVASLDTPVPFSSVLEKNFLPAGRIRIALERLLAF